MTSLDRQWFRPRRAENRGALLEGSGGREPVQQMERAFAPKIFERHDPVGKPVSRDAEQGTPSPGPKPHANHDLTGLQRIVGIARHRPDRVQPDLAATPRKQDIRAAVRHHPARRGGAVLETGPVALHGFREFGRRRDFVVPGHETFPMVTVPARPAGCVKLAANDPLRSLPLWS